MAAKVTIVGSKYLWDVNNDEFVELNCAGKIMPGDVVLTCSTISTWTYNGVEHTISVKEGETVEKTLACSEMIMSTNLVITSSSRYDNT